ncbi:MAG: hypothetical protein KDC78_12595 [Aequorivita sp.]|nr:hypothetical protein [Aequorivita sp.]
MKKHLLQNWALLCAFFLLPIISTYAQVGIGTTTPDASSLLDIEDVTGSKGLLIPRVALSATNVSSPISPAPATSLLVYNTVTAGTDPYGVYPGYYYWDGSKWVALVGTEKWDLLGNAGTDEDTNFVGTTDGQGLTFRTNDTQRFRVANGDQVLAMADGSAAAPFYSWNADKTMGFWRSGTRQMDMVINGSTFFNANANTGGGSDLEWSFNPAGVDMNLRVETDNNANSLFVSGEDDNVGLGTNAPDPSSQLEMSAINRGLLVNRVTLTATTNPSPIGTPATGLLVYNTATSGSGSTAVRPGFYYWDGSRWYAMDGTNGKDWSVSGNNGTNATNDFLGTIDAQDLAIRTTDTERMRFAATGNVGVNNAPYTNVKFNIEGDNLDYGLYVNSDSPDNYPSPNGATIWANQTGDGDGIIGQNTGSGIGVFGYASSAYGVLGQTPYTGGAYITAGTVGIGTGADNANGMLAATLYQATSQLNVGLRAIGGGSTSYSNTAYLNVGVNTNSKQLGLYSMTEGPINNGFTNRVFESAMFHTNYSGSVIDSDARDPVAKLAGYTNASQQGGSNMFYGGYFYSGGNNSGSWAYAGARYGNTNYKIVGNGTVSTIVEGATPNSNQKVMFAPEAPEVLLEDYGTGQLVNGSATIAIDPIFSKNIDVNNTRPLKVFIQLEGDCNGVYVTNKSANGFTVKELQSGRSNVAFSWHIVGNRRDDAGRNGSEGSTYASLRFPDAPSAMEIKPDKATEMVTPEKNITPKLISATAKGN